ncbi:MAG: DNRLRE domain-containing protein [Ardenticatenaceae bacterium]|nr:DNRLRE domain-containing protein [Ardenticatenaceae bacterium]
MTHSNSLNKAILLPLAALLLFAILGLATTLFASGDDVVLTPDADAYVISNAPNDNFGTRSNLQAKNGSGIVSYIRFQVDGWDNQTATLRLYALNDSSTGVDIYAVADSSWQETTITAGNAPALGGLIASSGSLTANSWVDIDVTSAVTGNGPVTLALRNTTTTLQRFASREGGSTAPQLILNNTSPQPTETIDDPTLTTSPTPVTPQPTPIPSPTFNPEPTEPGDENGCIRGNACPPNPIDP